MSVINMVLLGKERFLKKDKSGYCYKMHYSSEFTPAKFEQGCVGGTGKDIFISEECWYSIKPEDIGKKFDFVWGSNDFGHPAVKGITFLE